MSSFLMQVNQQINFPKVPRDEYETIRYTCEYQKHVPDISIGLMLHVT